MTSAELTAFFEERLAEIEEYLKLLVGLERAASAGPPRIDGVEDPVSTTQMKMLYSSVYLQIYNLVEATVSRCIESVTAAASDGGRWMPGDLNESLRKEWVRVSARTHTDMSFEKRLDSAVSMFEHLVDNSPLAAFAVEVGGGGNWDDESIEKISGRLGCNIKLSRKARTAAKKHIRDDMGSMKLVKNRRNLLAHGSISFVDCADGITAEELTALSEAVGVYLREITNGFSTYIDGLGFVRPELVGSVT